MSEPLDTLLYAIVKAYADKIYKKPSAYKSGFIVKTYKELGGRYKKSKKNKNEGLLRWFAEKWTNQRGEEGYKYKSDIYRPNIKISDETPKTFKELSDEKIKKARRDKLKKGRAKF
jgi:hypothetical protein